MARSRRAVLLALALAVPWSGARTESPGRSRSELILHAENLLNPRYSRATEREHIVVVSDGQFGRADAVMARNFESVYKVLQTILRVPPPSSPDKGNGVRAYLFQKSEQYRNFERFYDPREVGRSDGMYFPGLGLLAFHLEAYSQPWVRHVMLHECTHAFLDQRIRLTKHAIPAWLQEGLAEYIGLSVVSDGQIHVGVFTKKTKNDSFEGMTITTSQASHGVSRGRKALRHGLSLDTLLTTDPNAIKDREARLDYYATTWLLMNYLRGGRPEWSENQFPTLVREIGAGHSDRETLETVYGMTAKEIEAALVQHVKDFKLVSGWSPDED